VTALNHELRQYERAEELERYLGDPLDEANASSFASAVALDEREEYPSEALAALGRWGLNREYIPARYGGEFASYEILFSLLRSVARRDLTVALIHVMTYVATIPIWVLGDEEQRRRYSSILERDERIAIALTEKAHGADVLSNEVEAVKVEGGYRLSGEKWLISNASRSTTVTLFAKTGAAGSPRGYSLFLVEKGAADPSAIKHLPKIKTHGIRGADIGGIGFKEFPIGEEALVGAAGGGLEGTLKSWQVSRTLLPAPILGACDTALRAAVSFALSRKLYGGRVADIPYVRSQLAGAFADLLACDCLALSAARSLHAAPSQASVWSAVTKYFVPVRAEAVVREMSVVLGARHYLREGHFAGIFQKIVRESATLAAFHVGSYLNLTLIGQQQHAMADYRAKHDLRGDAPARARLETVFNLASPLPTFAPAGLELTTRGRDDLLGGLEEAVALAHELRASDTLAAETLEAITSLSSQLLEESRALDRQLLARGSAYANAFGQQPEMFELARRHCVLAGGAATLRMWLHNRERAGGFFAAGEWLALALQRLLAEVVPQPELPENFYEQVYAQLLELHEANRLFSIVPVPLPRAAEPVGSRS
jgi:alkylation response protein AidB-like acyl-CoA dehydrogenase